MPRRALCLVCVFFCVFSCGIGVRERERKRGVPHKRDSWHFLLRFDLSCVVSFLVYSMDGTTMVSVVGGGGATPPPTASITGGGGGGTTTAFSGASRKTTGAMGAARSKKGELR